MASPLQAPPPTNEMPQHKKAPTPPIMVDTPEATQEAAPASPLRVDPQGDISLQPGRAPRLTPRFTPHIILEAMEPIPPASHQSANYNPTVTKVHRYNTHTRWLQDLMENCVATINTSTAAHRKTAFLVRPAGEEWAVIDQATVNLTLQPVMVNAFVCPKTGKDW